MIGVPSNLDLLTSKDVKVLETVEDRFVRDDVNGRKSVEVGNSIIELSPCRAMFVLDG